MNNFQNSGNNPLQIANFSTRRIFIRSDNGLIMRTDSHQQHSSNIIPLLCSHVTSSCGPQYLLVLVLGGDELHCAFTAAIGKIFYISGIDLKSLGLPTIH